MSSSWNTDVILPGPVDEIPVRDLRCSPVADTEGVIRPDNSNSTSCFVESDTYLAKGYNERELNIIPNQESGSDIVVHYCHSDSSSAFRFPKTTIGNDSKRSYLGSTLALSEQDPAASASYIHAAHATERRNVQVGTQFDTVIQCIDSDAQAENLHMIDEYILPASEPGPKASSLGYIFGPDVSCVERAVALVKGMVEMKSDQTITIALEKPEDVNIDLVAARTSLSDSIENTLKSRSDRSSDYARQNLYIYHIGDSQVQKDNYSQVSRMHRQTNQHRLEPLAKSTR